MKKVNVRIVLMMLTAFLSLSCALDNNVGVDQTVNVQSKDSFLPPQDFIAEQNGIKNDLLPEAGKTAWGISKLEEYLTTIGYGQTPIQEINGVVIKAILARLMLDINARTEAFQPLYQEQFQNAECSLDYTGIKKGDILLMVTHHPSCMALDGTNTLHHALICIADPADNDDKVFITANGNYGEFVDYYSLQEARASVDKAVVLRLYQADSNVIDKAVQYAIEQIGKPYNMTELKYDSSSFYCSQLVWQAYFQAGVNLDSNDSAYNDYGIVLPSDIFLSPYLYLVKYSD